MVKLRSFLRVLNIIFFTLLSLALLYLLVDVKALSTIVGDVSSVGIFATYRLIPVIVLLLFVFINLLLIITYTKRDKNEKAIQFNNETGIVRISAHSIETLAKLEAQAMEDISDIRTQIHSNDNNASLEIFAKVPPTVSIPEVSLLLQNNVKRKILEATGIELKSIKIIIDGILNPIV